MAMYAYIMEILFQKGFLLAKWESLSPTLSHIRKGMAHEQRVGTNQITRQTST